MVIKASKSLDFFCPNKMSGDCFLLLLPTCTSVSIVVCSSCDGYEKLHQPSVHICEHKMMLTYSILQAEVHLRKAVCALQFVQLRNKDWLLKHAVQVCGRFVTVSL